MQATEPDGGPAPAGKRALLIGVDAYQAVTPLQGCVNDIVAIRDFLLQKAGMVAADMLVLVAPAAANPLPADLGTPPLPSRQNILDAFDTLGRQTHPGDQVVIYYSGHGVRIGSGPGTLIPNPANRDEHISAIAPVDTRYNGTNLMLNSELNSAINRLLVAGAQVTAVIDACHSGGITRDIGATPREIQLDPAGIDWAAFQTQYYGGAPPPAPASRAVTGDGSGWVASLDQAQELIVLAGCRDSQLSREYIPAGTTDRHGALTYFLLDALRNVDPSRNLATLRWADIYPQIRDKVNTQFTDQTPTLEGRTERPVFGGTWRPYAPGFTVTVGPAGTITLDGGELHGLGTGAQLAIYPPATPDFDEADRAHVAQAIAQVDTATAVTSQVRLLSGDPAGVVSGSRARLIKAGAGTPRLNVLLTGVPDAIAAAIRGAQGANSFLDLTPAGTAPTLEVRRWTRGAQSGWAVVRFSGVSKTATNTDPVGENDVIGFLPDAPALGDAQTGDLLAAGLVHWARYQGTLTRRNLDPTLAGAITLEVLADANRAHLLSSWAAPDAPVRAPDAAGQVVIRDDERLLLRVKVAPASPVALNVAILLCSDEGDIQLLWPPPSADNLLPQGEQRSVGLSGPLNLFKLPVSAWQTASRFTFKLIATDEQHPFETRPLALAGTVQDLFTGGFREAAVADTPDMLWTTVEVPVLVSRATA